MIAMLKTLNRVTLNNLHILKILNKKIFKFINIPKRIYVHIKLKGFSK